MRLPSFLSLYIDLAYMAKGGMLALEAPLFRGESSHLFLLLLWERALGMRGGREPSPPPRAQSFYLSYCPPTLFALGLR